MKNQYRLKLEIKLKDYNSGTMYNSYDLIIKVLKKDNRFDIPFNSSSKYTSHIFTSSDDFVIDTNSSEYRGYMSDNMFTIPNKKHLNRKITKIFTTDHLRKVYLKKLYNALIEWSNEWDDFSKEPKSKFKSIGNKWYIYVTK